MRHTHTTIAPSGRLVPIFTAHSGLNTAPLTNSLARSAASRGETVLMIDASDNQSLMNEAGIIFSATLGDVLYRGAHIRDAKYVSHNEHYSVTSAGDASLEVLLGSMAALSLGYDWVFVLCEHGCTPAHVKLAAAADTALLSYGGEADQFMRAYWMLDAIRARAPKFDPLIVVYGSEAPGFESYDMFKSTVQDFLGAAPSLGGLIENQDAVLDIAPSLLEALRSESALKNRKAS